MKYQNDILDIPLPISSGDTQQMAMVRQFLECRARLNDSKINNRLLHELVFKYSELEKEESQIISSRRVLMNRLAFEKDAVFFYLESQVMISIQEIFQAGIEGRNRFFANGMALRV